MKRKLLIVTALIVGFTLSAQQYPPEWAKYTTSGYYSDVQCDYNSRQLSESALKNQLLNTARVNLAKQIKMQVADVASINKSSIDGYTQIHYSANTTFRTDVELQLVETGTHYNPASAEGCAIAYINKQSAVKLYRKQLQLAYGKVRSALVVADYLEKNGEKGKAKAELAKVEGEISDNDDAFMWLAVFGCSEESIQELIEERNELDVSLRQKIASYSHSIAIYLNVQAELFGADYSNLGESIKGGLHCAECHYVTDKESADWIIIINATTRKYSAPVMNGYTTYFSYADASVTIVNGATQKTIYQDLLSEKGGHTRSYEDAARLAYKELSLKISEITKQQIE